MVQSLTDNIKGGAFTLLEKGDLVRLNFDHSGETLQKTRWCAGTNERSKKEGDFPLESLYILPTLSKPPPESLVKILLCASLINLFS